VLVHGAAGGVVERRQRPHAQRPQHWTSWIAWPLWTAKSNTPSNTPLLTAAPSFQLPNQADLAEQVKAWSWLVHELRRSGGDLTAGDGDPVVPSNLEIFAVTIAPREEINSPAYAEAQAAFDEIRVTELTPEDADRIGLQAADALATRA
jgi:hypothetical protein